MSIHSYILITVGHNAHFAKANVSRCSRKTTLVPRVSKIQQMPLQTPNA